MLRRLAPQFAKEQYHALRNTNYCRRLRLTAAAKRLSRRAARTPNASAEDYCDLLWASGVFRPMQIRWEIARLYEIVRALRPSTVCEIGAADGGTTFLFARAAAHDALLISLDLNYDEARRQSVALFAQGEQRIVCLDGDSHVAATLNNVTGLLDGRHLDFLFIDGDHSFAGVAKDFEMYSPLLRRGGIVAFHDIVPVREGDLNHYVGGVPEFWRELKRRYASTEEIVEDANQSAFGIGVLRWE